MKYLFLDIDGVLNTKSSLRNQIKETGQSSRFVWCEQACSNLQFLIREFDVRIVVSSTWKYEFSLEKLRELFGRNKINAASVIDVTPGLLDERRVTRAMEIAAWIKKNDAAKSTHIIIDDVDDGLSAHFEHVIKCDPNTGFADPQLFQKCINILSV